MPPLLGARPIFYSHRAMGHPFFLRKTASGGIRFSETWENVRMEGHPFSQNGHPFSKTPLLEGIKRMQLPFLNSKRGPSRNSRLATFHSRGAGKMCIVQGSFQNFTRGNCKRLMLSKNGVLEKRMPILRKRMPLHPYVFPRFGKTDAPGCRFMSKTDAPWHNCL